jgi:hypothetical protein
MRLRVSAPIICIDAEADHSLSQTAFAFHFSVFVFWAVVLGLSITVIVAGKDHNVGEIYWWGGSSGILSCFFCSYWLLFVYGNIQYRHVEIRILEEKLSVIAISINAQYIPFSQRNMASYNADNSRWSKFLDISKSIKQFRWESQIFLGFLYLLFILEILYLTCLLVNSYIAAFIVLAIALLVLIYSIFRFTILGVLPITSASVNYPLSRIYDHEYTDQLSTLFDFMHGVNDAVFWMLYAAGCIVCICAYIISLFYLST